MRASGQTGACRSCGETLVDWNRVHKRDIRDLKYIFSVLKLETFRHYMWHVDISQRAINYARRKGKFKLREAVRNQLSKRIGSANPPYDGRQTPRETSGNANIIDYAQHALACCCRKCLEYWHQIPKGRELTEEELEYLTNLVMKYVDERLPDLADEGIKVSPLKRHSKTGAANVKAH